MTMNKFSLELRKDSMSTLKIQNCYFSPLSTYVVYLRFITIGSRFLWSPCCSYNCFFLVLVCPCQLFVRLWYRVSDVLDLSLVSKRFGFWPHITHVIVLTFKEIKHLADYRTVGLSDRRTIGLSDYRTVGL